MQNLQAFLEQRYPLIKKIFRAYCLNKRIRLASSTQKALLKKLLQNILNDWAATINELEAATPSIPVLIEMTRLHCQALLQDNHTIDMQLLQTQPSELVVKYQAMIVHIVNKQVDETKAWDVERREDLIAQIQENLLQKIVNGKLTAQFKGESSFHHYLYRVIYHSMIDELRKRQRIQKEGSIGFIDELSSKDLTHYAVFQSDMVYTEWVEQHISWLQALIKGFPIDKQRRFEFALMVVYRLYLKKEDVRKLYENCEDDLLVEILSYFSKSYHHLSLAELYNLLSNFITLLENRPQLLSSESFRVWFQTKLIKIKKTLFSQLPSIADSSLDRYFELLVYKLYKKN